MLNGFWWQLFVRSYVDNPPPPGLMHSGIALDTLDT